MGWLNPALTRLKIQHNEKANRSHTRKPHPTGGEVYQTNFPKKVQTKRLKRERGGFKIRSTGKFR